MSELSHVSPSSIKTYMSCNRKWWWEKIMGVPGKTSYAAVQGISIHEELENWLMNGTTPSNAVLLRALDQFPPPQSEGVHIEEWLNYQFPLVKFKGRADVIDLREDVPVLLDLKTTGNIKYALTKQQLKFDLQMNAYAFNIFNALAKTATKIKFKHVYITTRGEERVKVVEAVASKTEVQDFWDTIIVQTVQDMLLDAKEEWREALETNLSHCSAYGGCAYRNLCKGG